MKIILTESVPHLGEPGAVLNVKPGYARNFLIPQGLAALATHRNIKKMDQQLAEVRAQIDTAKADAEAVKERLSDLSVTVSKPAGEAEKLFGSVTTRDIVAALAEEDVTVDKRRILIAEPIKSLGVYTVQIKLHQGELVDLKVWVVKE